MSKSYTLLAARPQVPVGTCAAILPNKMKCWRGADVLVEDGDTSYQLCLHHSNVEQQAAASDTTMQDLERQEPAPPPTDQAKLETAEPKAQQPDTVPPTGQQPEFKQEEVPTPPSGPQSIADKLAMKKQAAPTT